MTAQRIPMPGPLGTPGPGAHGGDGARVAAAFGLDVADVLDLSASLNPVAPDPGPIVAHHLASLGRYPDPARSTAVLAERLAVDPDRLLLTNGGAEAIALVGALLGGTVDEPDFSLYPRSVGRSMDQSIRSGSTLERRRGAGDTEPLTSGGPAVLGSWCSADATRPTQNGDRLDGDVGTGLFDAPPRWRSNPHSPSGRLADATETAGVWDEAFWPLATATWTRGDHRHGAVVVGSLTKLLACPGLRVGYLIAPESEDGDRLLAAVRLAQPAWSVGGLVCAALPDLLYTVDLPGWAHEVGCLRQELVDLLASCGLRAEAADAPWVLVADAADLRARLAPHGVVVRDCTSFGRPGTVRIAVPDDQGRRRLGAALEAVL